MPSDSPASTAKDIRRFAVIQIVITVAFLAIVFLAFDRTEQDFPPIWLVVVLAAAIAVAAFFAERVWLRTKPLDPERPQEENELQALDAFTTQTLHRLIISESPLLLSVLLCFVGPWSGWPVLLAAVPGLALQVWETYPSLRNTSMAAAMMDSHGARSMLVENFRTT